MTFYARSLFSTVLTIVCMTSPARADDKPLLRDFMGLCTHTIQHRPDLYAPITSNLRDYHGFNWDVGDDSDFKTTFPLARNRVNWKDVYGSWRKVGSFSHALQTSARSPLT